MLKVAVLLGVLIANASAVIYPKPKPDAAPKGYEQWISPLVTPSPPADGSGDWNSAVQKAKSFVSQLTLEEKVNLTTGVGTTGRCLGNTGSIPRLGFAGICFNDSPAGIRLADLVSVFPSGQNTASTWDKNLILQRATALGEEFRGKGINVALNIGANIARAQGADPYMTSVAASLAVQGIQSQGVVACVKHLIGNEQEHFRGGSLAPAYSSNIDDRTMHEVYGAPFAAAIHAGAGSVMCAYNRANQTFTCENSKLMNGFVKTELNFQGAIVSDWASQTRGVDSALAGLDVNMPGFANYGDFSEDDSANPIKSTKSLWGANLLRAVKNGSVPENRLDDMNIRLMASYYKLKQDENLPALNFDVNPKHTALNKHVNVQGNHKALIREIGAASTILLKNTNGTLPLQPKSIKNLAIFGTDAGSNPDGINSCSDRGCDKGTLAQGWGSGTAEYPYLVAPVDAITSYMKNQSPSTKVISVLSDFDAKKTAAAAKTADQCLVFVNADSGEGYITVANNAGDRNNLTLWNGGDQLIKTVATNCKSTIVIAHLVGAVIIEPWIDLPNVKAFLNAGLPGQESGNAITDVLFGEVNPSGRLVYTMAKRQSDYPAQVVYKSPGDLQITYNEGLFVDYRWFDQKNIVPRYAFGYGLSYTTFAYSGLSIKANTLSKRAGAQTVFSSSSPSLWNDAVTVTFTIANTGKLDGHEVAQLYLSFPAALKEPVRVLRGFERQFVAAGQKAKVCITMTRKDISYWHVPSQSWQTPGGTFKVNIGSSSRDLKLSGFFSV